MLKPYVRRQFQYTNSLPTVQFVNSCAHDDTDTVTKQSVGNSENLSAQQSAQLKNILREFSDVFSFGGTPRSAEPLVRCQSPLKLKAFDHLVSNAGGIMANLLKVCILQISTVHARE